ncbi:hypothetical protein [uncultured Tenacibaculum sp.]|uniref:hypothetical protein n=1 Tax=uncultured Tenacibaculum sp. TaxID=174713 RepID=UPI0026305455|nr:hypothetical protein [uncultured Tenacibaculum sp.]
MKFFDYMLKFGFGIALGLVIIFKVSPILFNKAKELKDEIFEEDKLHFLSLESFIPNDYEDIRLRGELSKGKRFTNIYEVSQNPSYNNLLEVLFSRGIIDKRDLKGKLPFSLTSQQLSNFGLIKVKFNNEDRSVEKLIIDNKYIIGTKPSTARIWFIYFLGSVIFLLGMSSLLVTLIMLYKNVMIFMRTEKLPDLPNTVETKKEGLKFLMKWFRKNK